MGEGDFSIASQVFTILGDANFDGLVNVVDLTIMANNFGQSGTFLWVDPEALLALIALADRDFGPWAIDAWPPFSDGVLAAGSARPAPGG